MSKTFNKDKFSELLIRAMGNRNMSEYALHAGISLTYLSELIKKQRNNPPMPPTIKKLAAKAYNGVTYEELMVAAGHLGLIPGVSEQRDYEPTPKEIDELLQGEVYFCGEPITEEDLASVREFAKLYLKTLKQKERKQKE